nr:uncharacterized protein LOC132765393 [Anolis sagrei ordinatus]
MPDVNGFPLRRGGGRGQGQSWARCARILTPRRATGWLAPSALLPSHWHRRRGGQDGCLPPVSGCRDGQTPGLRGSSATQQGPWRRALPWQKKQSWITGCLCPTPLETLHCLAGIATPNIRWEVVASNERTKALTSSGQSLFGYQTACQPLKSRNSFLRSTEILAGTPQHARDQKWQAKTQHLNQWLRLDEKLSPGHTAEWTTWKVLNRLHSGITRCRMNLKKWGYGVEPMTCECGEEQTIHKPPITMQSEPCHRHNRGPSLSDTKGTPSGQLLVKEYYLV